MTEKETVGEVLHPQVRNPIDTGKKTIDDLLKEKKQELEKLSFINPCALFFTDDYIIVDKRKFITKYNNCICLFVINKKKKTITINKVTNFTIPFVKEIIYHKNPLLGDEEIKKSFIVTIQNENGNTDEIELKGDAKSEPSKFQSTIDECTNGNIYSGDKSTFKEFFSLYIAPENAVKVDVYSNAGVLNDKTFLYGNALYNDGEIYYSDKDGYIR